MPTVLVRVKQGQRGEYGVAGSEPDPKHPTGVAGYTNIIRNEGEAFQMDTRAMKNEGAVGTGLCETVTVKIDGQNVKKVLPSWVESVKKKEVAGTDALEPKGHQTTHRAETSVI